MPLDTALRGTSVAADRPPDDDPELYRTCWQQSVAGVVLPILAGFEPPDMPTSASAPPAGCQSLTN